MASSSPLIGRLPAPSPDAVAELTRPDSRVLVLGEHLGRLRGLAEGLLRAHYVAGQVDDNGGLVDAPQLVRDILSTWTFVRALIGPGDLRVDRLGRRASVHGRQLALRPVDFRVLRVLAEHVRQGCTRYRLTTRIERPMRRRGRGA